jgi:peptide/nickel transport system permease protein
MVIGGCFASLSVAAMAVLIGAGIGIPLGLIASANDNVLSRAILSLNDFIFAFPALVTAILIHNIFGSGIITAGLAIGIFNIPIFARTLYGAARPLWTKDFIKAARLAGKNTISIAVTHILPLVSSMALAQISMQMGLGILAEAGLSYVGLGVVPPMPSWGRMLNEAQTLIVIAPRLAIIPGLAIAASVFMFTWIGDKLSDYADPKRREGHDYDRA